MLLSSLEELGAGRSILVDRKGNIIAGNKTAQAARDLKMKNLRVVQTKGDELVVVQRTDIDIDSKKGRKLAIADNRIAEIDLDWDPDVLRSIKVELPEFFTDAELRRLIGASDDDEGPAPQIDRAAELQQKWKTERGQIWEIGKHRLMCGDSTDAADVQALMGRRRAKLLHTDSPFMVSYAADNHPQSYSNKPATANKPANHYIEIENQDVGFYSKFLTAALEHALEERCAVYQWHAYKRQAMIEKAWEDSGLLLHQQIIWSKSRAVLTRQHFMQSHETCFYGWRKGKTPELIPPNNELTVWTIDMKGIAGDHPTEKPLDIFVRPIVWHTKPDDLCYEPFNGSGTCMVAAEKHNRTCYALELSPPFVAVALERMADMGLKPKLARRAAVAGR